MGIVEILLILAVALIVINPDQLPEVMRTAGKLLRELRAASNTVVRELTEAVEQEQQPPVFEQPDSAEAEGSQSESPEKQE